MRRLVPGATIVAVSLICVVAGATHLQSARGNAERPESGGEAKKTGTGRSFKAETVVEEQALASAAAPGFDSERAWSGYDDWEPAVAADPSSSWVYQMTTRYNGPKACNGCPFPVVVFRSSSNGGQTWNADRFMPNAKKTQNDPQIEVATDGAVYALWLDAYNPGVRFSRSTNHGTTWSAPLTFSGRRGSGASFSDRPILAISRDGHDVYVAFNASDSYVASSHNYGASFAAPVKTSNDTRYWFHTQGAVAPDGSVFFVATDYSQDYTGDTNIQVLRSTNGGASFVTTLVDTSREAPGCPWAAGCYFGFLGPVAGIAVDPAGTLVLAYGAGNTVGAPQRLYTRRSTNGGATWSARVEVSDPNPALHNGFPAVAAGPAVGDFRLIWQGGGNSTWNAWGRKSTTGGSTWNAAVKISDLATGAPYKTASGHAFPYGDYLELAVDGSGRAHYIWGEGASYDGPGGTWYTSGVN